MFNILAIVMSLSGVISGTVLLTHGHIAEGMVMLFSPIGIIGATAVVTL